MSTDACTRCRGTGIEGSYTAPNGRRYPTDRPCDCPAGQTPRNCTCGRRAIYDPRIGGWLHAQIITDWHPVTLEPFHVEPPAA